MPTRSVRTLDLGAPIQTTSGIAVHPTGKVGYTSHQGGGALPYAQLVEFDINTGTVQRVMNYEFLSFKVYDIRDLLLIGCYIDEDQDGYFRAKSPHHFVIRNSELSMLSPRIHGDRILFLNQFSHQWSLYTYDVVTGVMEQVTLPPAAPNNAGHDIHGDLIVYGDQRNVGVSGADIYMRDLLTGIEIPVTTAPGNQFYPVTDGNYIVWLDDRQGNSDPRTGAYYDIYAYHIATGQSWRVTDASTVQKSDALHTLDIDQGRVVWADLRYGVPPHRTDIFLRDLNTLAEQQLTEDHWAAHPRIQNQRVVYDKLDVHDIELYDLNAQTITPLVSNPHKTRFPAIYDELVVYQEKTATTTDLHLYDITTGLNERITYQDEEYVPSSFPDIYADRITYTRPTRTELLSPLRPITSERSVEAYYLDLSDRIVCPDCNDLDPDQQPGQCANSYY